MDKTRQIICDTDVIIDWLDDKLRRHQPTKNILIDDIGVNNIQISCMTKMELIQGTKNKTELAVMNKKIGALGYIPLNSEITHLAIEVFEKYKLSFGLGIPDSFIAATALYFDLPLFTYNIKDYKMIAGLKLYKPS